MPTSEKSPASHRLCLVWPQFGPYHHARLRELQAISAPGSVVGVQVANLTSTYAWTSSGGEIETLLSGVEVEEANPFATGYRFYRSLRRNRIDVAFLPSYWPMGSLVLLLAAIAARTKLVMMNESHAGTAQATGWKQFIKRRLIRLFDAALIGGEPHRRYFATEGIPADRIFTGYDAVDNRHFSRSAEAARTQVAARSQPCSGLPPRYVLSLGRLVTKKNLPVLLKAHAELQHTAATGIALVIVGSGPEEEKLKTLAGDLGLSIVDAQSVDPRHGALPPASPGSVYFYGFRQIEENPWFYAFADAFVLPSLYEEWGLVVNEAMACGLPVVVSGMAGCAEDLVEEGGNGFRFDPQDAGQLAAALCQIATNDALRVRMGQRSAEIISRWDCDNFARQARAAAASASNSR